MHRQGKRDMPNLNINGRNMSVEATGDTLLLWAIREQLQMTGTKFGCGAGLCGACTVHVNGQATRSCLTTMRNAAGKEVTTIEGLDKDGLHPVQRVWMEINVPQCGYCQAGQIMQAASLLNSKKKPTDQEIDEAMAGNICRCGTYQRIRAAIKAAAGEMT